MADDRTWNLRGSRGGVAFWSALAAALEFGWIDPSPAFGYFAAMCAVFGVIAAVTTR